MSLARRPLYSHAKQPRFRAPAQPSPPVFFRAPRSKQYHSPAGSASVGVGSPSSLHRSLKCDCEAERFLELDHPPLGDEFPRRHGAHRCEDEDAGRRRPGIAPDDVAPFIEA